MVLVAPQQVIDAPTRAPLPYGLFSAAPPVSTPGFVWQNGVTWMDQACAVMPPVIVADCESPVGLPKEFDTLLSEGVSSAFTVYGEFLCSPLGFGPDGAQQQAEARLLTREEQAVTAQVATLLTEAGPLQGDDLATPTTADEAVPALEQHLAVNYGSQGVLIATLEAFYALGTDHVVRVGNGLQTLAGTPIVIERTGTVSGFDIGIIPAPLVYRGEVFTSSNRDGDLLDTSTNDLYAVAERSYVVGWLACGGAHVSLAA